MRRIFVGLVAAATIFISLPAFAITFPQLTTIYVGSGIRGGGGITTIIQCANVSGVSATLRFLLLGVTGVFQTNKTMSVAHGASAIVATADTQAFVETAVLEPRAEADLDSGVINIEATQSGIFCDARLISGSGEDLIHDGATLPLVRVNPHPGTAE